MARLIKRYGSRKLYDPNESRYISLEEISALIRLGEEIQVLDNATTEDVTAQTLTQVIAEESRKKSQFLSPDTLHQLIRVGESAVAQGVKQIQKGVDKFVKRSIERIKPVSNVREEMQQLRQRLEQLEQALAGAEGGGDFLAELDAETAGTGKSSAAAKTTSKGLTRKPAKPKSATGRKSAASAKGRTGKGTSTAEATRKSAESKTKSKD